MTESFRNLFSQCVLTFLDITDLDSYNVTDTSLMFFKARSDNLVDLSRLDTSMVVEMVGMFQQACIYQLDRSNWKVKCVKDMSNMFRDAVIHTIDISRWNQWCL